MCLCTYLVYIKKHVDQQRYQHRLWVEPPQSWPPSAPWIPCASQNLDVAIPKVDLHQDHCVSLVVSSHTPWIYRAIAIHTYNLSTGFWLGLDRSWEFAKLDCAAKQTERSGLDLARSLRLDIYQSMPQPISLPAVLHACNVSMFRPSRGGTKKT